MANKEPKGFNLDNTPVRQEGDAEFGYSPPSSPITVQAPTQQPVAQTPNQGSSDNKK